MAFVLRGADLGRVADAMLSARLDLIGLAVLAMVATYLARAIRWCYLLEPLGRVHLGVALRATVMGFAATAMLPGRVGELLRPYVLARQERLSVSATIGTVVLERLLDLAVILADLRDLRPAVRTAVRRREQRVALRAACRCARRRRIRPGNAGTGVRRGCESGGSRPRGGASDVAAARGGSRSGSRSSRTVSPKGSA